MKLLITKNFQGWRVGSVLKIGIEPDWSDITREVSNMLVKEGVAKFLYENKQMNNYQGK